MTKSVCLHAAFLRTPRDNPWTGGLDPEDSAYPYGDWTSRAHAESYGPFAFDPVLDPDGRTRGGANLYATLSFSFPPLLLAWLETPNIAIGTCCCCHCTVGCTPTWLMPVTMTSGFRPSTLLKIGVKSVVSGERRI